MTETEARLNSHEAVCALGMSKSMPGLNDSSK